MRVKVKAKHMPDSAYACGLEKEAVLDRLAKARQEFVTTPISNQS